MSDFYCESKDSGEPPCAGVAKLRADNDRLRGLLAKERGCGECWQGTSCGSDCRMNDALAGTAAQPPAAPVYKVIAGSASYHCCFEASILDTSKPVMVGDIHYKDALTGEFKYEVVCECFEMEDAQKICNALNALTSSKQKET